MTNSTSNLKHYPERINPNVDKELRAWSDKLDVTKARLKAAINTVGNSVKDIEAYLKKK
ncbi:MAG: DUF3606 domain-containing protein [Mucilaginibacter sp.]